MVTVKTPNRFYNGIIGGVQFKDGTGIFADAELGRQIAKDFGFAVELIKEEKPEEDKPKARRPRKAKDGE